MHLTANRFRRAPLAPTALAALTILLFVGCTSKSNPKTSEDAKPTRAAQPGDFDGGTYCAQTFLQGPATAQPLHFSNKITESDQSLKSKDFQADLSGDSVDLVHRDTWLATDQDKKFFEETSKFTDPKIVRREINNGMAVETVTNHATRSDGVSWRGVVVSIAQGGTPWGLFIYKPMVSRVGDEAVNGFDTVKYAVDTTHESSTDKSASLLRNLADYNITGTAWVLKNMNCVLQYDITDERTGTDGKVNKTHYEGAVTKK
ncbi:MAG TPA: hypothetical protein VFA90_11150 [Terriglobales bacterium]|nr:hypothetical protein [Terriglobales bacterium]